MKKIILLISILFLTTFLFSTPYVEIPATKMDLVVRSVTIMCDTNGVPEEGFVTWEYKTAMGDIEEREKINQENVLTLWNLSRQGQSLDEITDMVIAIISEKKGIPIQGSVSNVVPYMRYEIVTTTNENDVIEIITNKIFVSSQ